MRLLWLRLGLKDGDGNMMLLIPLFIFALFGIGIILYWLLGRLLAALGVGE